MQRTYKGRIKNLNSISITDKDRQHIYYEKVFHRLSNCKVEMRVYSERIPIKIDNQYTNIEGTKINILMIDDIFDDNTIHFMDDSNDIYLDSNIVISKKNIELNNSTLMISQNKEVPKNFIYTNKDGYIGEIIYLLMGKKQILSGIYFSFWLNYNSTCNIDDIINYFIENFNIELNKLEQEKFF